MTELDQIKDNLRKALRQHRKDLGVSQTTFSELGGTDQPRISELENGKLHLFSIDGLLLLAQKTGLSVSSSFTAVNEDKKSTIKVDILVKA